MNVNQLHLPPPPQLQRLSKDGSEKDADFLALRLLNRRTRLRLSPEPIPLDDLPPRTRLFAVANTRRSFVAAIRTSDNSYALSLSPLADLRSTLASASSDAPPTLNPTTIIPLHPGIPHIVVITHDDSRIIVAFTNGSIAVFDWSSKSPIFTFPSSGTKPVRDIFPSTGDSDLVAVLRDPGDGISLQLLDVHNFTSVGGWNPGGSSGTIPTSVSWSPKGKQIAIGLDSGHILTFSPSDTSAVKTLVPHPLSVDGQSLIALHWLSNTEFHAVYAPPGQLAPDSEQTHFILSHDPKANTAGDVKLTTPYLPFPGLRPPASFAVALKNWDPSRFLLFIGDSTSSDVGLIGSLANAASPADSWYNLTLEEESTPSVPLDADLNETVLLGLELDVTNAETFRYTGVSGEATDVPPPPIMYLYASDGTLSGWHIIQTQGVAYPDMSTSATPVPSSSPVAATAPSAQASAFSAPQSPFATSSTAAQPSAFASTQNVTTASTSSDTFGFSAFSGAPSAFGSTSFGFVQQPQLQQPKAPSPPQAPALSTPSMSIEMTSSTDDSMAPETESGFGGLSLGGGGGESKTEGTNSMFGSLGTGGPTARSTFGTFGSGPVKPATGFGAFASTGPSAFGTSGGLGGGSFSSGGGAFGSDASGTGSGAFGPTQSAATENKPASGFGQSGFGAAAASAKPAFGQSSFGQSNLGQPSFGQPSAFGNPAFGASSLSTSTATAKPSGAFGSGTSAGGFAAFASQGTSAFGAAAQKSADSKPAWATGTSQETPQASTPSTSAVFGDSTRTNAFGGSNGPSAFSPSKPAETSSTTAAPAGGAFAGLTQSTQAASGGSVFGKTTFGQSSFGQNAFGQSSFGQPSGPSAPSAKPTTTRGFGGGGGFASFANAGPSAFGAAAARSHDAKPTWAAGTSHAKTAAEESKSAFGFEATTGAPSTSGDASQVAAPASPVTTPATSPEKPAAYVSTPPATPPVKPETKPETTTPTTTPPAGGAFGGLKTSSTGFSSLQPGFGAFGGGSTTSSSSPFFQKPGTVSTTPTSVFGSSTSDASTTTPPSKDVSAGPPKFGVSSFGSSSLTPTGFFGKPAASTTPATPETPTNGGATKGAFSAFSGSPSPFSTAASSSSGKSFGDLLREEKSEDGKKEEKQPAGFSRTAEEWKKPVSAFAQIKQATAEKGKDAEDEDAEGEEEGAGDSSFRSNEYDSEGEDVLDDFLKSDEEDLPGEEDEEEEEAEEEVDEAEPTKQPAAPPTPSQSPTPKPQADKAASVFSLSFPPSSPVKPDKEGEPSKSAFTRAASTTPPGSPAPTERASAAAPSDGKLAVPSANRAASAPSTGTPGLTPSLLGVGRPSTRPARSSPLASRPISGDDEDEEDEEPSRPARELKKARSTSPAPGAETSQPKTPPTLFGTTIAPPKTAPFSLGSAASPVSKPPSPSPDAGKPAVGPSKPVTKVPPLSGPGSPGGGLFSTPPVFSPAPISQGGLFGQKPVGSPVPSPTIPAATPPSQTPLFGPKPSIPTPGGMFSSPFAKPASPAPTSSASAFNLGPPTPTQSPNPIGWPQAAATPVGPALPHPDSPVQSMLMEFTHLYNALTRELDDLKALAARASLRTTQLQKPSGSAKTANDLAEPTKWVMSDLSQFKHILKDVERGLEKWEQEKETCISHLRELESDMLKGSTRKEEVERFSKASKDAEFARMLKQRMLSPDHLETQAQLRRDTRNIRTRIQQLEEYIQASKKKLNSVKNGKPSFKPPSLDTINRTYRNIDTAIDQEEDELANLTERVAQLELSSKAAPLLSFSASTRDRRLPDRVSQRVGREVTPNIAASTAAALNAERSAQKLKKALLSARKEPLLNTKAVDAVPLEREHQAGQALVRTGSGLNIGAAFAAGLNGGFPQPAGPSTPPWSDTAGWSLPAFELDSSPSPTAGLGGGRGRLQQRENKHAKPIQLHQGGKAPPPPPPAGFSWGPVPVIQPKTTISIFGDSKGKAKENSLSDSWVADGFGK